MASDLTQRKIQSAQNDLERATETARQMVCRFGMSDKLGPQTFGRPVGSRYLESPVIFGEERNFSDKTAEAIDAEVRTIVETQHQRARQILSRKRAVLEAMVSRLLERETLDGNDLKALEAEVGDGDLTEHPAVRSKLAARS